MPTYRLDILVTGTDRASSRLTGIRRALQRIFQVASGILIAGTIRLLTDQIFDLGRTAVESYTNLERMEVSLQSLIARELARGDVIESTSTSIRHLSEAEILSLDKLIVKYSALGEEMLDLQEDKAGLAEGDIDWLANSVAIRENTSEMAALGNEIERMQGLEGAWITTTEQSLVKTLSLTDALANAAGPARELTDWIVRLSLRSPFEEKDILQALRVAAGYGFITQYASELGTEEERLRQAREDDVVTAQRLTVGLLDLMAAIGLPSENLGRIVLALGQVRAHGRLLAQEIRQLVNAGVGLDIMAMAMGMTVQEFMNAQKEGAILAEDFLPALIKLLEEDLAGAADRIMATFGGALLSLRKFREVALRVFFGPTFRAITPWLESLVETITAPEYMAKIERWGEAFRDELIDIYNWLKNLPGAIEEFKTKLENVGPLKVSIDIVATITDFTVPELEGAVEAADEFAEDLGFMDGAAEAAKGAIGGLLTVILGAKGFKLAKNIGKGLLGIILGIGSGIGWIGVVAGLLGAAWSGNWFGMRDKLKEVYEDYIKPTFGELIEYLEINIPLAIEEVRKWWEDELLPALQNVWAWIEDTLIPQLMEWGKILSEKVVLGIKAVVKWVNDDLIPALEDTRDWLRDEVIPAFVTWYDEAMPKVETGIANLKTEVDEKLIPTLGDISDHINDELLPDLGNLSGWFLGEGKWAAERFSNFWDKYIVSSFDAGLIAMAPYADEETGILGKIGKVFDHMSTDVFEGFHTAWEDWVKPVWDYIGPWSKENVLPVVEEAYKLLKNLTELFTDYFGEKFEDFATYLGVITNILNTDGNSSLQLFLDIIRGVWDIYVVGNFVTLNKTLGETVIPALTGAFDAMADALFKVERFLRGVNMQLDLLLGKKINKGTILELGSPPLLARLFDQVTESIERNDEALRNAEIGKLSSNIGRLPQGAFTFGPGGSMGTPVYVEGDRNTFIVPDQATGQFVVHMIEESKKRRFSEYMGRV